MNKERQWIERPLDEPEITVSLQRLDEFIERLQAVKEQAQGDEQVFITVYKDPYGEGLPFKLTAMRQETDDEYHRRVEREEKEYLKKIRNMQAMQAYKQDWEDLKSFILIKAEQEPWPEHIKDIIERRLTE